jgi:predicted Zn-dependent peptidase
MADESSQTHIGIAFDSVPYPHPDYYLARGAIGVLSDGMSSRLFTEVREKRGLCYTVYASCHSLRDRGSVLCYSGTTTDRAQETIDVILAELKRLSLGVEVDELDRLKARIKSTLIMQQESSPSRSGSIAADWYFLGRIQTLQELRQIIDGLTCERINRYLADHPPSNFSIVTVGEKPLEVPRGVS